ncbi:MAG: DNA repair protein RadC [Bacteroidales bacterium]|nr:DNA repair protein RadC [Bacteroidales bacterium]
MQEEETQKDKTISVKDWSSEDQPRERLIRLGARSVTTTELLAILLRTGRTGQNVVEMAKEVLNAANGSLNRLSQWSVGDLKQINGIAEAKAVTICAAMELGHRLATERHSKQIVRLTNATDIYNAIMPEISDLQQEEFWALYVNTRMQLLHKCCICKGGLTETLVDIRVLFKTALSYGATMIAVAHNHPTGQVKPSKNDDNLTKRIREAGRLLSIPLMDHIIIGSAPYNDNGEPREPVYGSDFYSYHLEQRLNVV